MTTVPDTRGIAHTDCKDHAKTNSNYLVVVQFTRLKNAELVINDYVEEKHPNLVELPSNCGYGTSGCYIILVSDEILNSMND